MNPVPTMAELIRDNALPIASEQVVLPFRFELLPRDKSSTTPQAGPTRRAGVQMAFQHTVIEGCSGTVKVWMRCGGAPADLAFRAFLRDGNDEYPLGDFSRRRGEVPRWASLLQVTLPPGKTLSAKGVTVVLRPDASVAAMRPDLPTYWNEVIVIENAERKPADDVWQPGSRFRPAQPLATRRPTTRSA
jgi:hypothetical protein